MAQELRSFRQSFKVSKELLNWYPGHMEKGLKAMQSKLRGVDCVVEVHDARVALSGRNPNFVQKLLGVKPHILVLNKKDLILKEDRQLIISKLKSDGTENVIFTNCLKSGSCEGVKKLVPTAIDLIVNSDRYNRAGVNELCMMIIGIPNVGKSSLINALRQINLNRKSATPVGAIAGVTRSVLHKIKVNVNPTMYLIDTPGILFPHFTDIEAALKLALCSCYNDRLVTEQVIADFLLYHLNKTSNFEYVKKLKLKEPMDDILHVLACIASSQNLTQRTKSVVDRSLKVHLDLDRAAATMIAKFRKGLFGLINLDKDLL